MNKQNLDSLKLYKQMLANENDHKDVLDIEEQIFNLLLDIHIEQLENSCGPATVKVPEVKETEFKDYKREPAFDALLIDKIKYSICGSEEATEEQAELINNLYVMFESHYSYNEKLFGTDWQAECGRITLQHDKALNRIKELEAKYKALEIEFNNESILLLIHLNRITDLEKRNNQLQHYAQIGRVLKWYHMNCNEVVVLHGGRFSKLRRFEIMFDHIQSLYRKDPENEAF